MDKWKEYDDFATVETEWLLYERELADGLCFEPVSFGDFERSLDNA